MKQVIKITMYLLYSLLFFSQISCDETTKSELGTISVLVVDNDANETPIPNIEITVTPINIVKMTDSSGTCKFEVSPGNYFVDAEVCCLGPGNIVYHEPVNVVENITSNLKLEGCLLCD